MVSRTPTTFPPDHLCVMPQHRSIGFVYECQWCHELWYRTSIGGLRWRRLTPPDDAAIVAAHRRVLTRKERASTARVIGEAMLTAVGL
jgi:hypothetical protein